MQETCSRCLKSVDLISVRFGTYDGISMQVLYLMTRSVYKSNLSLALTTLHLAGVSPNGLCDSAGLSCCYLRLSDEV